MRGADGFLKFKPPKVAPRCGTRAIWKSKSLKAGGVGALFEIQVEICTGLRRESDLEVKIVKARGRRSDFDSASTWTSLKRIVILRPSVWSTCHISGKSRRTASVISQLVN